MHEVDVCFAYIEMYVTDKCMNYTDLYSVDFDISYFTIRHYIYKCV